MSLAIDADGGDPYLVHASGTCKACDLWRNTPCDLKPVAIEAKGES